ncbi:MAG: hypothetical protein UHM23_03015 [Clostridia bacterium]|nr:hypothetical protein [Clostridia bacterium]
MQNSRNEVKCGFIRISPCLTVYTGTSRVSFADSSKAIDEKKSAIFIADFNK